MTTRTQQLSTRRWVLPFLAALIAVLAAIFSSATASAATQGVAETRVRASSVVVEVPVGPPEHIAAGQRLENDPGGVVTAVATGVAGESDAHHIIQNAAVRDVPGYSRGGAPSIRLDGPSTTPGTPHYNATRAQEAAGVSGTYGAERQVAACALAAAGCSTAVINDALQRADNYFMGELGLTLESPLRVPGTHWGMR